MNRTKSIALLFLQFLKFGCFTFGGGWSIISQMKKVYIEENQCITKEELLDLTSIGRSLPGTMIGNVAMLFGYRQAGILGGIACVIGLIIPPVTILSLITLFYSTFYSNPLVAAAMGGIRVAVVPIILSVAFPMMKGAVDHPFGIVVALSSFVTYLFFEVNCVWIIGCSALSGLLVKYLVQKKGTK